MNAPILHRSTCPHDCPSTCAIEIEVADGTVGRLRGSKHNSYTSGVICAKVARYAERLYHPDRLKKPLVRTGGKGAGSFTEIDWEEALDRVAEKFLEVEKKFGSEAVWPYNYAGTMGLVQRDSIHRLRHLKRYSNQFDTICTNMAWTGYIGGTGKLAGPDPREMADADVIVIWGCNPVNTQVNVMTHATAARKNRGARIVAVDVYQNDTMKQADLAVCLRPGTDGALACAVMHILFRDGYADRAYLEKYTDDPEGLEEHLKTRTPEWAAGITGLSTGEIEELAALIGQNPRTFFRLGYGFTRSRNGAASMHAVASIAAVTGAWKYKGGGAFHSNGAIFGFDNSLVQAPDQKDMSVRHLDQSQIGRILTGDETALKGGPGVHALLVQNTNPVSVAPEQDLVKAGFARDDLFVCVHEQFMTETAQMADIVLPATMFPEHDDLYRGGGHSHFMFGPKIVEAPGECRPNVDVINGLAKRLGVSDHEGFSMTVREHIRHMLRDVEGFEPETFFEECWLDIQPDFEEAHYISGFGWPDGKYRFKPDWNGTFAPNRPAEGPIGPWKDMPEFPDHWDCVEAANARHPFRLVTAPARSFLNSSFNETKGSLDKEGHPEVLMHPDDAAGEGLAEGQTVTLGNERGTCTLTLCLSDRVKSGSLIAEGLWPNSAFEDGKGINTMTGADEVAPFGGAAFHDTAVWIRAGGRSD